MTREMKNSGIEWIGEIPVNWDIIKVKNLFNIGRGRVIAKTELEDSGYPIYSSQTKNNGVLGYISTYDYDIDQLTWTTDGANAGTVFLRTGKYNCTNVCGTLAPKNNDNNLLYMKYALEYIAIFHKRADTNGYKIMNNEMANIKITIPPINEQNKIAGFLDSKVSEIDKLIAETKSSIENYKEYKQSVITEAVTKGLNKNVQMKDSGYEHIGSVPSNWRIGKIKNIFDFVGGFAFQSDKFVGETDYQVLRIGNVKNDKILFNANPVYINEDYIQPRCEVKKDDILFTMTGTRHKKDYFYTVCVDEKMLEVKKMYINQRVGAFSPKVEMVAKYFSYLFKTEHILDNIFLYETGTANQGNLGIESISNTVIQIPPIEEQEKITAHLDSICIEIDNLISEKETLISNLEEYKKSLIYEYVTGKKAVN